MLQTSVSGFSRNQSSCHTLDTEAAKLGTTVTVNGNDLKCNEDNESRVLVKITLTPNNVIYTSAVRS